jgi:hypothetical protein
MNAATEKMTEVLKARDWNFELEEESGMLTTGCRGENGQWRVQAGPLSEYAFAIFSRFPVDCPAPKRQTCSELLTRINFAMVLGCFEMDFEDGMIFFKTTIPHDEEPPKQEHLDNLLSLNMSIMDRYLPAIMQVIYSGVAPAKAMAELKKSGEKAKKATTKSGKTKLDGPSRFQMN